jgi:hypothetical protein
MVLLLSAERNEELILRFETYEFVYHSISVLIVRRFVPLMLSY